MLIFLRCFTCGQEGEYVEMKLLTQLKQYATNSGTITPSELITIPPYTPASFAATRIRWAFAFR